MTFVQPLASLISPDIGSNRSVTVVDSLEEALETFCVRVCARCCFCLYFQYFVCVSTLAMPIPHRRVQLGFFTATRNLAIRNLRKGSERGPVVPGVSICLSGTSALASVVCPDLVKKITHCGLTSC